MSTSEQQERLLVMEELVAHSLDRLILGQNLLELLGNTSETLHDVLATLLLGCAVLAQGKSEHDERDILGSVGLGGSNTNFGTGVDVDTAMGEERDGGSDNVHDTDSEGTTLKTVAEGQQRVGGLTGLRDKDTGI